MDTSEQLGQLFMVGIPRPELDPHTRRLLLDLRPGGVILFSRNYTDLETLGELCRELHGLDRTNPPLIAIDHEGGRVQRLGAPFTHFPPARRLTRTGASQPVELAYRVGRAMGHELRAVGIDLNFAPVLDVLTNADNDVIGDRAFSSQPQQVAALGSALARGLREAGVIPCGKHFPGHGATQLDSHQDLPTDERSASRLEQTDLVPFRRACGEQLEMLMTAHVVYPALDPDRPASLSQPIVTELLRHGLGFDGVVVSDDLEMGAIVRHGSVEQAAVQALAAGTDLLLVCHSLERAVQARDACLQALAAGRLSARRLAEARRRIGALKTGSRQLPPASAEVIGCAAHTRLAEALGNTTGSEA